MVYLSACTIGHTSCWSTVNKVYFYPVGQNRRDSEFDQKMYSIVQPDESILFSTILGYV